MLMAAGVEFGAMRATVTGAVLRVVGTALALWIPLTPLIFIMRRALSGKTNSRCTEGHRPTQHWPTRLLEQASSCGRSRQQIVATWSSSVK